MDILELVRLLRTGENDQQIARLLGHNCRTVIRYQQWATEQGLLEGEIPSPAALLRLLEATLPSPQPPQQTSSVTPYAAEITAVRAQGLEITAIRTRLEERHQHPISYSPIWRFVQRLEPQLPEAAVRVEVPPGSDGQVDFSYAGLTIDPVTGTVRKIWLFELVLS